MSEDILIPVGFLAFIALFAFAMIRAGRRQRAERIAVFRDFADRNGLAFLAEDDGRAQAFAREFDGIGRFASSSGGTQVPTAVVNGVVNGTDSMLFLHAIRFSEGDARQWYVAGLIADQSLAEQCAIQFGEGRFDRSSYYLSDPVLKEHEVERYTLVVRAPSARHAGRFAEHTVLEQLGALAGSLSVRPELQVRGNHIVAYPADRNATVTDVRTLADLHEFARQAATTASA